MPPPKKAFSLSVSGRVLLFTVIVWLVLLAGLGGILDKVFRPTFVDFESSLMVKDLERVEAAVGRETEQLNASAMDYASWDDMRSFIESGNKDALPTALNATMLRTLDLDAIFVFDPVGRVQHALHQKSGAQLKVAREYNAPSFASEFPVIASARTSSENSARRGLVRFTGGTLVFAAAAPIRSKSNGARAIGTVVMLRELDQSAIERLGEQVRLPLQLEAATPDGPAPAASEAKPEVVDGNISASAWLRDPFGQPIARFTVTRQASILAQGEETLALGGLGSLVALSVILAMLLLLLHLTVVRPIHYLTRRIEEVRRTGDLDLRLGITRADEIGLLAYNFDRLLSLLGERTRVLEELATTDGLTKLPNRRTVMEYLEGLVGQEDAKYQGLAVLLLDIDHFKRINDTAGHGVGDRVLRQVAKTLREVVREPDRAGRYGGEEFLIVLPAHSRQKAIEAGERVRMAIAETPVQGVDWPVTVSIGVATFGGHTAHGLLATADMNLYRAKEAGRNRVVADEIPFSRLPAASVPPPAASSNSPTIIR